MNRLLVTIGSAIVILSLVSACAAATPVATATSEPTATGVPPTKTARPTPTPRPTATPNVGATEAAEKFAAVVAAFEERGYMSEGEGEVFELEPFEGEWAQLNWYQWSIYDRIDSDFLFSAHFSWSTASSTPDASGCGIAFGVQPNSDHYVVFLDQRQIMFRMGRGEFSYLVGKTTGTGRVNFGNPAEADFALSVVGQKAYVSVNGEFTTYTLSADQSSRGDFGYSILSGTNRDYGTRCEISDAALWVARQ